ncbi:hypothetical protein Vretifemale_7640 [Volvox reticuliferus]|nr:hypothetical protein Vretifemale_7640 [Volvox reticuliferus]
MTTGDGCRRDAGDGDDGIISGRGDGDDVVGGGGDGDGGVGSGGMAEGNGGRVVVKEDEKLGGAYLEAADDGGASGVAQEKGHAADEGAPGCAAIFWEHDGNVGGRVGGTRGKGRLHCRTQGETIRTRSPSRWPGAARAGKRSEDTARRFLGAAA